MNFRTNKARIIILLVSSMLSMSCVSQAKHANNLAGKELEANINQLLASENLPGLVMLIRKKNKIIHHQAYGYANIESQQPMSKDHLFRLYSMTKPITALTTLQVLAEKKIAMDTPLQAIFPEFKQHSDIPLWTLMTHTSGFSYGFKINRWAGWKYLFSDIGDSQTLVEFMDHLADLPLLSEPGVRWRYSFSSDVQGALVEKLTGKKLSENMNSRLFSRLGMQNTSFYVEPERVGRLAPLYSNNWFGSSPNIKNDNSVTEQQGAESGGSGLVSTAEDYSRFVQLLMTPESYPDIVQSEDVALMTSSQLPKVIPTIPERYYSNSGYGYGLGVKIQDEQFLSKGSFYWAGKGGTIFWADPKNALSVVVMMQYEGGNKILERELVPMVYNWLEHSENTTY
jgi:CubicO group peptidase (beta-lactamase class C family)